MNISPPQRKVALVTGAMGGIGLAVVHKLIASCTSTESWDIYGIDIKPQQPITQLQIFKGYFQMDLSRSDLTDEDYSNLLNQLPRLDLIVHCAALQMCSSALDADLTENWNKLMNVNVKSVYQLARVAHPLLKTNQGNVVVVSSVHATASSKDISMYAISKNALTGLIRNLAIEWAGDGIRVNGVAPGATDTEMLRAGLARSELPLDEALAQIASRHLIKRILRPEEIAEVIYFLGNDATSSAITGQTIIADGCATSVLSLEID